MHCDIAIKFDKKNFLDMLVIRHVFFSLWNIEQNFATKNLHMAKILVFVFLFYFRDELSMALNP